MKKFCNLQVSVVTVFRWGGEVDYRFLVRSHARTVVRECCKGDDESQWERGKFDPPPPKNPLTDGHQNLRT